MPRVPYASLDDSDDPELVSLRAQIKGLRGQILNLHRSLANCPPALRSFMSMSRFVRDDSSLPANLRELVILTVAHTLKDDYEIGIHEPIALSVGVRHEQLADLDQVAKSMHFSGSERAAVLYAREATAERHVRQSTTESLQTEFTASEIVELSLIVGWYQLCHVLIETFGIDTERNPR